jgi:hypothetical protein
MVEVKRDDGWDCDTGRGGRAGNCMEGSETPLGVLASPVSLQHDALATGQGDYVRPILKAPDRLFEV